jgi:hypothetical protein
MVPMYRKIAAYTIILLVLALLIGLTALNYSAPVPLIIGAIASLVVLQLLRFIFSRRTRILVAALVVGSILTFSLLALGLLLLLPGGSFIPVTGGGPLVAGYHATIDSSNWQSGSFLIKETVDIDPEWVKYWKLTDIPASV